MDAAQCKWVLLMSSHCLPMGNYFFQELKMNIENFGNSEMIAGLRLVMQKKAFDYKGYLDFVQTRKTINIDAAFDQGILASGAIINKDEWNVIKFMEQVVSCEDKIWSYEAIRKNFVILPSSAVYL